MPDLQGARLLSTSLIAVVATICVSARQKPFTGVVEVGHCALSAEKPHTAAGTHRIGVQFTRRDLTVCTPATYLD